MCFHFANDFRLCHHQNDKNEIYNVAKSRFLFHFIIKYTYTKIKLINYGSRARCVCAYCCWYIQMVFFVISNETSLKCVIFLFKTWDHFKSFSYNKCISHFLGRYTHTLMITYRTPKINVYPFNSHWVSFILFTGFFAAFESKDEKVKHFPCSQMWS